ncbi:hypothetical protein [Marinomonas sp. IMCC 4694]|uniref:hypothetical protein n=1 Tax=Marinomonas sp. IMCC 4694 TaxID=2605432 RepID=UPI0011E772C0|nr:hypothetical protein [Marinomonas sp. IMCC 4694]TYL46662.1 hypothetical protein FXV75_01165 [Marinomonas sp. IMCC 4694]
MNRKDERLEHLAILLDHLEKVSLEDISVVPLSQQHVLAEKIETLQDELKALITSEGARAH